MKILTFTVLLLAAAAAAAQTLDVSGHWSGSLDIQGETFRLDVDFARSAAGDVVGTASSADAKNIPLRKVTLDGANISFYARSDQPYSGTLSADGRSMSGTIKLEGWDLPLDLQRTGDATLAPQPTSPAVSPRLEGRWTGALETSAGGHRVELVLKNGPDGRSSGHFVSVDEGGLMLYLRIEEQDDRVTLKLTGVDGIYSGTVSADGTTITGTFAQRGTSLPLTLTR